MRISDWSSDVCSSDLEGRSHGSEDDGVGFRHALTVHGPRYELSVHVPHVVSKISRVLQPFADALGTLSRWEHLPRAITPSEGSLAILVARLLADEARRLRQRGEERLGSARSEEHTSELQSLMSNSYAVFCLKK